MTNIDQISRIVNMFSKKQFEDYIQNTNIEASDETSLISELKKDINKPEADKLLVDYQYVFKPYNSCIIKFKRINDPENKLMQSCLGEWNIIDTIEYADKRCFFMEKNGITKKISNGWGFESIGVKEVGIAVLYSNLNLLEIRANMTVQKKIAKVFEPYLLEPNSLEINRNYYIAILEELRAKEFSVIWETEGEIVTKARLDGKNINVKDGALITIPGAEFEDNEIQINLITDANPKNVGSFIEDLNTKIHLSAQGHLKFTRLMKETEITEIIYRISSALDPLEETKNEKLNIDDETTIISLFKDFCESTKTHILNRFSRRYFSFRNLLSNADADIVIEYLLEKQMIDSHYELYDEDYNLMGIINYKDIENIDLFPDEYLSVLEQNHSTGYGVKPISRFYSVNSALISFVEHSSSIEETQILDEGMNNKIFVDEQIPEVVFDELILERKKRQLQLAISKNDRSTISQLAKEFQKHNRTDILEAFNISI